MTDTGFPAVTWGHLSPAAFNAIIWIETTVALATVAIRLWFKRHKAGRVRQLSYDDIRESGFGKATHILRRVLHWLCHGLAWDDLFLSLAGVVLCGMTATYTPVTKTMFEILYFADHYMEMTSSLSAQQLLDLTARAEIYLRCQFAIILLFWTQLWLVKATFLVYYKTLFSGGFRGWQTKAWWFLTVFCAITYFLNWPIQFEACSPLSNYFHLGACQKDRDISVSNASLYYSTAVDMASDILIMLLPASLLYHLKGKNTTERFTIGSIIGAGCLVITLSALRLAFSIPKHGSHADPRWLAIWSVSECAAAVIVASAPAFRYLIKHRRSGSSVGSSGSRRPLGSRQVPSSGMSSMPVSPMTVCAPRLPGRIVAEKTGIMTDVDLEMAVGDP